MAVNHTIEAIETSEASGKGQLYLILVILFGTLFLASRIWGRSSTLDPREPSLISSKIPVIGHALGMMMHQAEYLSMLCRSNDLPIFKIRIFSGQLYIINSPELTQAIFKQPKAFSFDPISTTASKGLFQMTDRQLKILANPVPGIKDVEFPLNTVTTRAMHKAMTLGPNAPLLVMNIRALTRFAQFLNPIGKEGISVDMCAWFHETFTVATSIGVYGPDSPIETDRSLAENLNDFEENIGFLVLNVLPSLTASKGHVAREAFKTAFQKYYRDGGHEKTSGVITARFEALREGGFTPDDIASFDVAIMMAASLNSNPALFWLISYIFSDPELLAEIRREATPVVNINGKQATIDISQLMKACPLLGSCMHEMLRLVDATTGSRMVMEDTLLNDTYLLRKGGIIQLVCAPMHHSSSIWGNDSHLFNARRFLKETQENLSKESRKSQKSGYTPFGGGASLCPGRHFATIEILGVAVPMAVGYDIKMRDGSVLKMPKPKKQKFGVQVKHVEGDVGVTIKRREGWEDVEWAYHIGSGDVEGSEELAFEN